MSTPLPPPEKFIVFLFVQEAGGERRLCGFASGGCVACSGRLRRNCTKYQATMLSCSASSGKPDSNSPDCIVAWYFCGSVVVSAWLGYSLSQMLFRMRWYLHGLDIRCCRCFLGMLWYLHDWDIRCCRCFLGCGSICIAGIFAVADAFFLPVMYNCIFNLPISWLADTHFY